MDLRTRYLGLELRSPLVASASPLTGDLDSLRRLQDAGAAAVVLPSLFEEQIEHESMEIDRLLATGAESFPEATSFFPVMDDYNTGPRHYLVLLEAARAALRIPVIASLNGTSPGGWLHYARLLEEAGASAIELNIYSLAADLDTTSSQVESRYVQLVTQIRGVVKIPLAVKLSPFYTALGGFARELVSAGADGLVLFNRFYQPDLDLDTLEVTPRLVLSTPGPPSCSRCGPVRTRDITSAMCVTRGAEGLDGRRRRSSGRRRRRMRVGVTQTGLRVE